MQYSPINMNENKAKKYFLGMVVMLLLACVVISIISDTESDSFGLIVGVLFLGSFALAILGVVTHMIGEADRKEREKERLIKRSVLEKELLAQESDVKKQTANLKRKLMLRYNQIYYCHRDDLLFIPGEAGYASCNDYERFLTQGLKTIKRKE